jgi:hypothetical protein
MPFKQRYNVIANLKKIEAVCGLGNKYFPKFSGMEENKKYSNMEEIPKDHPYYPIIQRLKEESTLFNPDCKIILQIKEYEEDEEISVVPILQSGTRAFVCSTQNTYCIPEQMTRINGKLTRKSVIFIGPYELWGTQVPLIKVNKTATQRNQVFLLING